MFCMLYWLTFLGDIVSFFFILGYFLVKLFKFIFGVFISWGMPRRACVHGTLAGELINKDFCGKTEHKWDLSISRVKSHIT